MIGQNHTVFEMVRPVTAGHSTPLPLRKLRTGNTMSRAEFHLAYERTESDFHAQLIGGAVYVWEWVTIDHGTMHAALGALLCTYEAATAGVEAAHRTTVLLGDDAEPEPDLLLRILPEFGGQTSTTPDDYVSGPPELIIEIAECERSVEFHEKRRDYTRHGVREYLVLSLRERQLRSFNLPENQEVSIDTDGVLRVRTFPGLWIDCEGLLERDCRRQMDTLGRGLASPEHAAFVERLADAHDSHQS